MKIPLYNLGSQRPGYTTTVHEREDLRSRFEAKEFFYFKNPYREKEITAGFHGTLEIFPLHYTLGDLDQADLADLLCGDFLFG